MKKKLAILLSLIMALACFAFTACGSSEAPAEEPAQEEAAVEENTDVNDGKPYGYMGDDLAVAAVYQYLVEEIAPNYDPAEGVISIPVVMIVDEDKDEDGDVDIYGEFQIWNYEVEGDTLKSVSGGSYPGKMEVIPVGGGYSVKEFEQVADGSEFDPTAKEIFEERYDDFVKISSDADAIEQERGKIIADYVKANGLSVTKYQDEGWDPVDIPL